MIQRSSESSVVSGPPLSVGRLRNNSARDPRVRWRGVGLTACIGTFELGAGSVEEHAGARAAVPRLLSRVPSEWDAETRSTRGARSRRAVAGFFETGGREIVILDDARCASTGHWIGEDGGPGRRTGVFQLLDLQDVSTLVVLAGDAAARERVLGVARRRPDKLFLFPGPAPGSTRDVDSPGDAGGGEPLEPQEPIRFLLPNAAEVYPLPGDRAREVDGLRDLGRLVAMLEGTDFADEPRFRQPSRERWPERTPGIVRLMAWRRWEGLRRSIELGSRWIVMEMHHPLVWRHIERDIRGFLHRMAEHGLVRGPGPRGFQVRCAPRPAGAPAARGAAAPAVDIRVAVRLKPPYDAALNAAAISGSDLDLEARHEAADRSTRRPRTTEVEENDSRSAGEEELL